MTGRVSIGRGGGFRPDLLAGFEPEWVVVLGWNTHLVEFDLFRVGVRETVGSAFLLEAREVGPLGEEIVVGTVQILERLLQGMNRRIGQP